MKKPIKLTSAQLRSLIQEAVDPTFETVEQMNSMEEVEGPASPDQFTMSAEAEDLVRSLAMTLAEELAGEDEDEVDGIYPELENALFEAIEGAVKLFR